MAKAPIKELLFGRLAQAGRLVTEEQIAECLELQRKYEERGGPVPRLGELLALKGFMTAEQVRAVLEGQHSRREGLFGEIALRWRLITQQDLGRALEAQREQDRAGKHRARLGEILVQRGLLRPHQVRAILEAQGKKIVHCSGCNARFNVAQFRPGARLFCSKCGAVTVLGDTERHVADHTPLDVVNTVWISEQERAALAESLEEPGEAPGEGAGEGVSEEAGTSTRTGLQIGGYEILSRLGSDGTGMICKARHLGTGDLVTIKILRAGAALDQQFLNTFVEKSKPSIYLQHPNLKRVYEVGCDRGRFFLAEEFVEGRSLKRHLEVVGRMTPAEAVDMAAQLAEALNYGHAKGIVHGDVRPSNVMIDPNGAARLSGLGVAKDAVLNLRYLGKDSPNTPFYLAPEAAVDPAGADARSDIYSLGAVLYHMLTGRPPYTGRGSLEVLMRLTQENPVPPEQIDPQLPQGLCKLVMRMLSAEPDDRPQTVAEVLDKLRRLAGTLGPVRTTPVTGSSTSVSTSRLHRTPSRPAQPGIRDRLAASAYAERRGRAPARTSGAGTGARLAVGLVLLGLLGAGLFLVFANTRSGRPAPAPPPVASPETPRPAPPAADDPAQKLYGDAVRFAEANVGDDDTIAARFKAIIDKYPDSDYGRRFARDRYAKHLAEAARRALEAIERGRSAAEAKGDFKSALAALEPWQRKYADAGEETLVRGRRVQTAIIATQELSIDKRGKEAEALAAAGKFEEARALLAPLADTVTPEGAKLVAAKLKELSDRELATTDAETRARLEAERKRREEEERRKREELTSKLAERAKLIRAEAAELVGARDFDKALELAGAFRKDAAGSEHVAAAAALDEVVGLAAGFHRALVAGIKSGRGGPRLLFGERWRSIVDADAEAVTLALGPEATNRQRWDGFSGRAICELARPYVPQDDGKAILGYAVYASALGQEAEARKFLGLAEKAGAASPAARAAVEGAWLLNARERTRREGDVQRLASRAEGLRSEAVEPLAAWNFPRVQEALAAARKELSGTPYDAPLAQAEEAVVLVAAFHKAFLGALAARKGALKLRYAGKLRPITDATPVGVTLEVEGAATKLPWSSFTGRDLAALAADCTDPKDGAVQAGCAVFLAVIGDEAAARGVLEQAERTGAPPAAARAAIEGRLLLAAEEKLRRDAGDRKVADRGEALRLEAATLIAGGDFDRALGVLSAARLELAGTAHEARRAQLEEAVALASAFNKVVLAGLKAGRHNPQLRYAGLVRKVLDADATAFTLDVEGARVKLPRSGFAGAEICALAAPYADRKDGASLLGFALFCSALGEDAEAKRSLDAAEQAGARSAAARAAVEGKWLTAPPAAPEKKP